MNKEIFEERKKLVMQFLSEKYKILPLVGTIAVATLALFSTSTDLIQDIHLFRVSLIILVSLIPFSIFALLVVINFEISNLIKDMLTEETELKEEITIKGVLKKTWLKIKKGRFKEASREILRLFVIHGAWVLLLILTIGLTLFVFSLF